MDFDLDVPDSISCKDIRVFNFTIVEPTQTHIQWILMTAYEADLIPSTQFHCLCLCLSLSVALQAFGRFFSFLNHIRSH
jgi:hypothetical protein